ncbi:hypothetical protein [Psychromicrobium lacuslunae]|uniref:hypothetical protein n=1 Tax=Psychromicrobium lacuslunae TaxID=1618207 RepID=UPI000696B78C|nr:hypothetical protein [Psychromicrobium lacuslunae]
MLTTNIDVTLRDGGYRNSFAFPLEYAIRHAKQSVGAGFDWVEIGYRNGSFKSSNDLELTARGDDRYIARMAEEIGSEHLAMILHSKNVSLDDIHRMYDSGARLLRICWSDRGGDHQAGIIKAAQDQGFIVSLNITRVSEKSPADLLISLESALAFDTDLIYFADSNGSLIPGTAQQLIRTTVGQHPGLTVGFHAHNNLGLALANSIAAVESGASWIDSSLMGMGKGSGNLRTEEWFSYLLRSGWDSGKLDLGEAISLVNLLRGEIPASLPELNMSNFVLGHFDLSVEKLGLIEHPSPPKMLEVAQKLAEQRLPALVSAGQL